jgi:hypothetical protein
VTLTPLVLGCYSCDGDIDYSDHALHLQMEHASSNSPRAHIGTDAICCQPHMAMAPGVRREVGRRSSRLEANARLIYNDHRRDRLFLWSNHAFFLNSFKGVPTLPRGLFFAYLHGTVSAAAAPYAAATDSKSKLRRT